ncbi:DDE-type integrase/transposase/recombinase [Sphingomonas japonica]|uniref:DDE-type integrase/transposase/recombinase n=1 Tax=Sphingomonas japonica TaxID=511662 RepID=UPI001122A61B|nr:DDE-type integrase/transposase/recombinase [Sphingomonas japonica]
MVYLWRAVDREGEILESYITRTRDKDAALRFMRKTLKRPRRPGSHHYRWPAQLRRGNERTGSPSSPGDRPLS